MKAVGVNMPTARRKSGDPGVEVCDVAGDGPEPAMPSSLKSESWNGSD